jgi:hypothetical protein
MEVFQLPLMTTEGLEDVGGIRTNHDEQLKSVPQNRKVEPENPDSILY